MGAGPFFSGVFFGTHAGFQVGPLRSIPMPVPRGRAQRPQQGRLPYGPM